MKSGFDILLHYASWLVNWLYHVTCTANLLKISTTVSYGSHHHAKHKIMVIKPILNFATSKPKLRHLERITHMLHHIFVIVSCFSSVQFADMLSLYYLSFPTIFSWILVSSLFLFVLVVSFACLFFDLYDVLRVQVLCIFIISKVHTCHNKVFPVCVCYFAAWYKICAYGSGLRFAVNVFATVSCFCDYCHNGRQITEFIYCLIIILEAQWKAQ